MLRDKLRESLLRRSFKSKLAFGLKENLLLGGGLGGVMGFIKANPKEYPDKSRLTATGLGALGGAGASLLSAPLMDAAFRSPGAAKVPLFAASLASELLLPQIPIDAYLKSRPKQKRQIMVVPGDQG